MIAAYRNGLKPLLCVGENLEEREAGKTARKINMQLKSALRVVAPEDAENLVVAYEPLWAIGSGKAATPSDAQEVCRLIREKSASSLLLMLLARYVFCTVAVLTKTMLLPSISAVSTVF